MKYIWIKVDNDKSWKGEFRFHEPKMWEGEGWLRCVIDKAPTVMTESFEEWVKTS